MIIIITIILLEYSNGIILIMITTILYYANCFVNVITN